jgi:transcriptional regulator with XRE-family HTH domain
MSDQPARDSPPEWDLADRMRKSLRSAGLGVQDMADYLEVSRGTVSNWINGRIRPGGQTLRLWALRTGVPYDWLHE